MDTQYKAGDYIEDRYLVTKVLAGGMGKVYVSYDLALDQTVAVKTLNTDQHIGGNGQGFLNEAQTWILLEDHPHIVQAKSSFMVRDQPFLVLEYVDGGDLRAFMRVGRTPVHTALKLAIQFCSAADYAYRKLGMIHRDIKPDNLLLTKSGDLKITDFGLSKIGSGTQPFQSISGTPQYMSPEQWQGVDVVTKQSDIYSFGVVLYEMLTGRQPFEATTIAELYRAHAEEIPLNPKDLSPHLTDDVAQIPLKCLMKNPLDRYLHYDVLIGQLESAYEKYTGKQYARTDYEGVASRVYSAAELMNRADSLFILGKFAEAMRYYDRLLDMDPDSAKFWRRKAETMAKMGKFHEAEMYFAKTLSLEPSNLDAVIGHTKCLMKLGRKAEALDCCSPALAINQNHKELLKLKQMLVPAITEKVKPENGWEERLSNTQPVTFESLPSKEFKSPPVDRHLRQCEKCGEMVDEARAFCPGCGHAFVEEQKRQIASEFEQQDSTVHLGQTTYHQVLGDMGLHITGAPAAHVSEPPGSQIQATPPKLERTMEEIPFGSESTSSEEINFYNTLDQLPRPGSIVLDADNIDPELAQKLRDAGFRRD